MSSLFVRRLIVWGVSIALGVIISLLIIWFALPALSPDPGERPIGVMEYGIQYFLWTAGPLALMFVTILDHFMDTRIWPD
ncbi:MAG: hypothetical protein EA396_03720 [Anaerolineaceae bacterium]|nr:MAG: hypothetical protein EA396_03720 [Anaerolineaceae bacterium]